MGKIKEFINETFIYGFANVFSRVFAMLLIPFYISNLGKIEYSNLVMIQSGFTILTFIMALNSGVFYYYYEWKKDKYRKMIFSSWFYYQIFLAMIIGIILFFTAEYISGLLIETENNKDNLIISVKVLGLLFVPYIFNITNINFYRIDRRPKKAILVVFFESLFTALIVIIGLNYYNFGIFEVVISQIIGRFIVSILFLKTIQSYFLWKYFSLKILKKLLYFSWPFFIISSFSWLISSIDKFIGVELLNNKEEIAILAFAFQITLPIAVLTDMIRMAIGPFIMSISAETNANKTYQKVYDLCVFSGVLALVLLIAFTPLITYILADKSFLIVIKVVPLIGVASILSLISNQFSISFSLVKKNQYILIATVIAGVFATFINLQFMNKYGFIVSGISQALSTLIMAIILLFLGRRISNLDININNSIIYLLVLGIFITFVYLYSPEILKGNYLQLIFSSLLTLFILLGLFIKTYLNKLNG